MTRITPVLPSNLAQYFSSRRRNAETHAALQAAKQASVTRPHFGNRRSGDRRGTERRSAGRRTSDQFHRHEVSTWNSSQIEAHLLGQWMEHTGPKTGALVSRFKPAGSPPARKGDIV